MTSGTSCSGQEGKWYCLTNSWQRCAAGQWSVVMQCAEGTVCTPYGLTDDFKVEFSAGYGGTTAAGTSVAQRLDRIWIWMLVAVAVSLFLSMT